MTDDGAHALAEGLRENSGLETLRLMVTQGGAASCKVVALTTLQGNTAIGQDGIQELLDALQYNSALLALWV